ncbi:MFS transporter [Buchnera aphidicola]|uniref:MFS transporter n=1 Tax=Buchnera aphidicola TaxID=9 RepID=UPI0034645902
MNIREIRVTIFVCLLFFLRIFALSIVMSSFSQYGLKFKDTNEFLIGLAIGTYGFFQFIFQIIFGFLSDKFGRKVILILGMFLFFLGCIFLALNKSIWGIIIGRSIQGAGAISSVLIAWISDIVLIKNFSKSMMFIGLTIVSSFFISIIFSPLIFLYININLLFWIMSFFSILCLITLWYFYDFFDTSNFLEKKIRIRKKNLVSILFNFKLLFLNIGTFFLYFTLTSNFIELPKIMKILKILPFLQFKIYALTIFISIFFTMPIIHFFEKNNFLKEIFILFITFLIISDFILLNFIKNFLGLIIAIQFFFLSFSIFSSYIPSLINNFSYKNYKGTTLSIYYSFQSLGSSLGGIFSSWIQFNYLISPFFINILINIFWLIFTIYFFYKVKYKNS